MEDFNSLDVAIVAIIALSTVISIYRGLVRELFTLIIWLLAFILAYVHGVKLGDKLTFIDSTYIKEATGTFIIFIGVILLGAILKIYTIKKHGIGKASGLDRTVGALFGAARGAAIIILAIVFVDSSAITDKSWYEKSTLVPDFQMAANFIDGGVNQKWKNFKQKRADKKAAAAEAVTDAQEQTE